MTNAEIEAKYGIKASQYLEFALLRGDASDGLPGVKGIGEKTAMKLLNEFGTIDNLYTAVDQGISCLTPAMVAKFEAGRDYVDTARTVVEVASDVPLGTVQSELPKKPANAAELARLVEQWGLKSSVDRLAAALNW